MSAAPETLLRVAWWRAASANRLRWCKRRKRKWEWRVRICSWHSRFCLVSSQTVCLFLALYDSVVLVKRVVSLLSCSRSSGSGEWRRMLTSAGLRSIWNSFLLDAYKQVKWTELTQTLTSLPTHSKKPFKVQTPRMAFPTCLSARAAGHTFSKAPVFTNKQKSFISFLKFREKSGEVGWGSGVFYCRFIDDIVLKSLFLLTNPHRESRVIWQTQDN